MRAENTNFRIVCAADNAEIYLYDVIGEDFFGGISAKMFADEMNKLKNAKNIDVRINSPGGNVFDGFTMYTLLKSSKANVNVYIDGLAASIASVIAMAGDSIEISATGMMMIHDPSGFSMGNAAEMRKMADLLDKIRDQIVDVYGSRTGIDKTELADMMAAETWFNPQEALDQKFATAVGADAAIAACLRTDLFKYKNMPKNLLQPQATSEELELRKRRELCEKINSNLAKWRTEHVA
jgi:ATP-dependent Clp protease, protease subunit